MTAPFVNMLHNQWRKYPVKRSSQGMPSTKSETMTSAGQEEI